MRTYSLVILFTLCLFSCTVVHIPKLKTANHFRQKHEINARVSAGMLCYNGVAATSLTNHILIQAGAAKTHYGVFNAKDTSAAGGARVCVKDRFLEIGSGYFTAIREHSFEIHGGLGWGQGSSFDPPPSGGDPGYNGPIKTRRIQTSYSTFYLQPSFCSKTGKQTQIAFTSRLTMIKYDTYVDIDPAHCSIRRNLPCI